VKIEYDYLIIGQGLAGSAMALQLLKRNRKFLVLDQPHQNNSSVVAAGIFNPITGKKWVKTWLADHLFPYMDTFYKDAEKLTGDKFFHKKSIFRPFSNLAEQNDWMVKSEDPVYAPYIADVRSKPVFQEWVKNPYGGLELSKGGHLDILGYLEAVRSILRKNDFFRDEHFEPESVKLNDSYVVYKQYTAKQIIFCQGPSQTNSGIWNFLPFKFVKGEMLTVQVKRPFETIFNKGGFILPLKDGICRVGATYDHHNLTSGPSEIGKKQLIEKLDKFFIEPFDILDHRAGIRPATYDRRPFIGRHPNERKFVIFNGLGAKGVTLAPYFAGQLLEHLENDGNLMKEINLNRIKR